MLSVGDLLVAHLIGDYLFQTDDMAANKKSSILWCLAHVLTYTLCVFVYVTCVAYGTQPAPAVTFGWRDYAAIAGSHFLLDHFGLASKYMQVMGQQSFAKNLAPWSTIVVDNTFHVLVLALLYHQHVPG